MQWRISDKKHDTSALWFGSFFCKCKSFLPLYKGPFQTFALGDLLRGLHSLRLSLNYSPIDGEYFGKNVREKQLKPKKYGSFYRNVILRVYKGNPIFHFPASYLSISTEIGFIVQLSDILLIKQKSAFRL